MRWKRYVVLATLVVSVGATATVVTASASGPQCESFPDDQRGAQVPVCGPVLERYRAEGGPGGKMGRPLYPEQPNTVPRYQRHGDRVAIFARGAIYLDTRTGRTSIPGVWVDPASR